MSGCFFLKHGVHSEASHIFRTFKLRLLYVIASGNEICSVLKNDILLCPSRATAEDVGTISIAAICLSVCLFVCLSFCLSHASGAKTVNFRYTVEC